MAYDKNGNIIIKNLCVSANDFLPEGFLVCAESLGNMYLYIGKRKVCVSTDSNSAFCYSQFKWIYDIPETQKGEIALIYEKYYNDLIKSKENEKDTLAKKVSEEISKYIGEVQ